MSRFAVTSFTAVAAAAACFVAGCASSTLQLNLAMYHGDPSYGVADSQTLPKEIARASSTVARVRSLVRQASERIQEATLLFEAYRSVYVAKAEAAGNPDAEDELQTLRGKKDKYVAALLPLTTELPRHLATLESAIAAVRTTASQLQSDPTDAKKATDLQRARADMQFALASIQTVLANFDPAAGADYVRWIRRGIPSLAAWLKANQRSAPHGDAKDGLKPNPLFSTPKVQAKIQAALKSLTPLLADQPQLLQDMTETKEPQSEAAVLERALPSATEATAAKSAEVAREVQSVARGSLFHDMLEFDNLQNAADPRWRVVKDPRNESNWVELKNQTYFYSEGKNSVVVVRDRPDDFRVQNASNNPTALIRSQLEISRAVTNAAIAIGGAAAGVPKLVAFPSPPATPGTPTTVTDDSTAGEQHAADVARIAEETRLRNAVLSELRLRLRHAQSDLDAAGTDADKIRAAAANFYAAVQGAKALLTPPTPAPSNPPATDTGGSNPAPAASTPPPTGSQGGGSGANSGRATSGGQPSGPAASTGTTSSSASTPTPATPPPSGTPAGGSTSSTPSTGTATPSTAPQNP